MAETSKAVISVASIVSAVAAFIAIFNAGYLAPLNSIIVYEYTLPQLIWLTLIIVGVAVIAYGVWVGFRSPKDFLKDTSQYLQQVGMSSGLQAQIRRDVTNTAENIKGNVISGVTKAAGVAGGNIAAKVNEKLPTSFQIHAAKVRGQGVGRLRSALSKLWGYLKGAGQFLQQEGVAPEIEQDVAQVAGSLAAGAASKINEKLPAAFHVHAAKAKSGRFSRLMRLHGPALDAPELEDFPLPGQIARALQGRYSVFLAGEASAAADNSSLPAPLQPLEVVSARLASSGNLESKTTFAARRLRWTTFIVVIAIAASAAAWLLGK